MSKQALVATVFAVIAVFAMSVIAEGADLSGTILYDDQPVATVVPDIKQASVIANPVGGGALIYGTVDLVASAYRIEGLATEQYGITILLFRTDPNPYVGYPGDLLVIADVEPTSPGDTIEKDLDARYFYHVVSPIDSLSELDGLRYDCTAHPAVAYPITFAIERVPLATDYKFHTILGTCPGGTAGNIYIDSVDPNALIEWGTHGEDFQVLEVFCTGASGKPLCAIPVYRYSDGDGWSLRLTHHDTSARGVHRTDSVVVPAVAGTPGANGTYWSSAVSVVNLANTDRDIEVLYTPRGADGLVNYSSESVSVPATSQLSWSDIVSELFSTTGAGALEFRGLQFAVTSRTSTPGADSGSYGQGIPPIQPEQTLGMTGTDSATMGGVEEGVVFRTNLGLCEVWGESATVRISVMDSSMTELGHRDYDLRAYENIQVNQVAMAVAGSGSLTDGIVRVTVIAGAGRIGAYLSVVDNATGDPTYIAISPQTPAGG